MADPVTDEHALFENALMDLLAEVYGNKPWVVAGEVAQGIAAGATMLNDLGAERTICIASRVGVGEIPSELRFVFTDDSRVAENASMVERIHDSNRELHNLPRWVIDEIDEWDPERSARVVASFTIDAGLVAERQTFGARRPEWAVLEDKIAIRSLWHNAGIETAPDRVLELGDINGLLAAHQALASDLGTVWAVDNDKGWHGGGTGTHWVPSTARVRELAAELAGNHRQVRVQPFLQGVPCSIHGLVLDHATLVFRPCEMIMLLDHADHQFVYARTATFWDPAEADRNLMRDTARRVGDALRDTVDFRGVFTLDGVLTTDGFRPTEVNPRFGAALPPRPATADGRTLPMFLIHLAAIEGYLDTVDPHQLEALIVDRLDDHRVGGAFIYTTMPPPDGGQDVAIGTDLQVILGGDHVRPAIATATWAPDPAGGLIFVTLTDQVPVGPPAATTVVSLRDVLNQHWALDLPDVTPAFARP